MKTCLSLLMIFLLINVTVTAQSNDEKDVTAHIESLRKAILSVNATDLDKLTADQLSYGHSSGTVEDKKEFIRKITEKVNVYTEIRFTNQVINVSGDVAIARHKAEIFTNDDGKPAQIKLLVMMVWQKQSGQWKLLARQSVKQAD